MNICITFMLIFRPARLPASRGVCVCVWCVNIHLPWHIIQHNRLAYVRSYRIVSNTKLVLLLLLLHMIWRCEQQTFGAHVLTITPLWLIRIIESNVCNKNCTCDIPTAQCVFWTSRYYLRQALECLKLTRKIENTHVYFWAAYRVLLTPSHTTTRTNLIWKCLSVSLVVCIRTPRKT